LYKKEEEKRKMQWQEIYSLIGPAGCVLVLAGLVGVYIAAWTSFYLWRVWREFRRDFLGLEAGVGKPSRCSLSNTANPMVRIVRDIVTTHSQHSDDIRAEVAYLFHRNFKAVVNSLLSLKLIATVSPLLGLLGTVLGMVGVFRTIATSTSPDPTMLAGGIWEALITTVMGLVVAIPVMTAYHCISLKLRGFKIEAIEYSYRAIEIAKNMKKSAAKDSDGLDEAA
jgi:biopolymer transport protein ExbB